MTCEEHKTSKRGRCPLCMICRKCPPSSIECQAEHVGTRSKSFSKSPHSRVNKRKKRESTENCENLMMLHELDGEHENNNPSKTEKKQKLLELLGITIGKNKRKGSITEFEYSNSVHTRVNANTMVWKCVEECLKVVVGQDDAKFLYPALIEQLTRKIGKVKRSEEEEKRSRVQNILTELSLNGEWDVQRQCKSILCSVYTRNEVNSMLSDCNRKLNGDNKFTGLCKKTFVSRRKEFAQISVGEPLPKRDVNKRLPFLKTFNAVQWITSSLPYVPGCSRNVRLDGMVLHGLPVYQAMYTKDELFKRFKEEYPVKKDRIGVNNFRKIVDCLTTKKRQETGLSPQFMQLLHLLEVTTELVARLRNFSGTSTSQTRDNINRVNDTIVSAETVMQFTLRKCLKKSSCNVLCLNYAIGGNCTCLHHSEIDKNVNDVFCLPQTIISVVSDLKRQPELSQHGDELASMARFASLFQEDIKRFAGHVARDLWQQRTIDSVMESLKTRGDMALVVINHKMKTEPQSPKEGQSDFFGKKGMSILGAMIVQCKEGGWKYSFIDIIMNNTSTQDSKSVFSGVEAILETIASQTAFEDIRSVVIQSDNACTFSSATHIRFVDSLNRKSSVDRHYPHISRWIFTEAGCGKSRLDGHFSYMNIQLRKALMGNVGYTTPQQLFDALVFDGGISETFVVLLDSLTNVTNFVHEKCNINYPFGMRAIHDIVFPKSSEGILVYRQSELDPPYVVSNSEWESSFKKTFDIVRLYEPKKKGKLNKFHKKKPISSKPAVKFLKTKTATKFGEDIVSAINKGGEQDVHMEVSEVENTVAASHSFSKAWAEKRSKSSKRLAPDVALKLLRMYNEGKEDKGKKWTVEMAHQEISNGILAYRWDERYNLLISTVKSFFSTGYKSKWVKELEKDSTLHSQDDFEYEPDEECVMEEYAQFLQDMYNNSDYLEED